MLKQQLILAGVAALTFGLAHADVPQGASDLTISTDFSGKPPFKRSLQSSADADTTIARLEEVAAPEVGDRVVEFRGKPPHKRSVVTESDVETASFARLEEVAEEPAGNKLRTRVGPPGKTGRTIR